MSAVLVFSDISTRTYCEHRMGARGVGTGYAYCIDDGEAKYVAGIVENSETTTIAEITALAIALEQLPQSSRQVIAYTDVKHVPEFVFSCRQKFRWRFQRELERLRDAMDRHESCCIAPVNRADHRYSMCHWLANDARKHRTKVRFDYYRQKIRKQFNVTWVSV